MKTEAMPLAAIRCREPVAEDALALYDLVAASPPLDTNSLYCNLLQCSHFSGTCVAAVAGNRLVGFVSAYLVPDRSSTLFVWQVAVAAEARGRGLAAAMLLELLARPVCGGVSHIETTITGDNRSSWSLFQRLCKNLHAELQSSVMFDRHHHFGDRHASEYLVRIGPLDPGRRNQPLSSF